MILCLTSISASYAGSCDARSEERTSISLVSQSFPILNLKKAIHAKPQGVEIYQSDGKPLGDRLPLLLVHGLNGEKLKAFRWTKVIDHFQTNSEFCRTYKIYLARYNTHDRLDRTKPAFRKQLLKLNAVADKPVTIVALSIGGNVIQESMLDDPNVEKAVRLVLTLATPFHGSPLFTNAWMQYSLYKGTQWIGTRVRSYVAYRIYFSMHSNLSDDLFWDNVDGRIPDIGSFSSFIPLGPRGDLNLQKDVNRRLALLNADLTPDKSKFITYAAYIVNPIVNPGFLGHYKSMVLSPYRMLTVEVPAHLAREHPVLAMMNWDISKVITAQSGSQDLKRKHQYVLNDGITPLNSALFLPRSYCRDYSISSEEDLQKVIPLIDVKRARVFRNADHLTFIDGMCPGIRSLLHVAATGSCLRDELAPEEGNRKIFDWITCDLLNVENGSSDLARNGKDSLNKDAAENTKIEGTKIEGAKIESLN